MRLLTLLKRMLGDVLTWDGMNASGSMIYDLCIRILREIFSQRADLTSKPL